MTIGTIFDGQMNGHANSPGADKTDAVHLSERLSKPLPWLPPSSSKPIPETDSPTSAHGKNGPQPTPQAARKTANAPTKQPAAKQNTDLPAIKYVPQAELDAELARLEELSQAALAGDKLAIDELRTALDDCPHIWRHLADLQQLVEHKLIELIAGTDPLKTEAFRKRCSELRHELLEGQSGSVLVKMAASRVVMCWMFCQFLELRALEDPADLRCIKQLEQAERRYQVGMRTFQMARHADLQLQRLAQQPN